jgi:spore coat protein A
VYAGLGSLLLRADPLDPLETLLPPAIPLFLRDAMFHANGQLFFDTNSSSPDEHPYWVPEQIGNVILVNGVSWPSLQVTRGVYRFVFAVLSDARFFDISLSDGSSFQVLSSGQGYFRNVATR